MVAWRRVHLLETLLVLLIDDDEAQSLEGQEEGASGAKDDVVGMVGELALPDLHALRVAIAGMIDAEAVAKDSTKALHHLHRKGNLGQEVEHLAALVEGALNEVDIDFGLAARCDAVKKRDILRHLLNEDLVVGVGLGLAEGFDVLGMGHSAEGDTSYFLFVLPQDPTVQKLAEDGGGAVGLVHQFLAGDLALGHGILFADAGQLQIGAEDLLLSRSALKHGLGSTEGLRRTKVVGQHDVGLGLGTIVVLGLETGREGGLIDVANGRKVVVGYPLP